jgi:glycosyltransferase involved in cell wall biosynthesis
MYDRDPKTCELRIRRDASDACLLMADLLPGTPDNFSHVTPEVCQACCRSFLPTRYDLNPVLASLVWSRCDQLLNDESGAVVRELKQPLRELLSFAEASLPLVLPDEDDLPVPSLIYTLPDAIDSVDALKRAVPELLRSGQKITHWVVGITTAPRREATLERCLHSLNDCGWDCIHLFIDGIVEVPELFQSLPRTVRQPAAGAWRNFYLSLAELLRRTPEADAIMMVQDDALWPAHAPVREYLSQIFWPEHGRYIVSPYCCADYTADGPGWHRFSDVWRYGAVAIIFSRPAAEEFLADPVVIARCRSERQAGIDDVIGEWAYRTQIEIFSPTPSLVQHIGDVSTLWPTARAVGLRRASRFLGDEYRIAAQGTASSRSILCGWLSADPPIVYHSMEIDDPGRYMPEDGITRFIMSLWHFTADEIATMDRHVRQSRPADTIHHCVNDAAISRELIDMGVSAHFINQNAFLDERLFTIQPDAIKIYDAVYNARMVPFKRHELAAEVSRLLIIGGTYSQDDSVEHFHKVKAALPTAQFTMEMSPDCLAPQDVNLLLNQSRVGLCLSAVEGTMYAATEYLLCGLPVVSTASVGGRDSWFDPRFTRIVPDDPHAVADAVQELIALQISPDLIRAETLNRMWDHRRRFLDLGQSIYSAHNCSREFARDFYSNFRNKIGDWTLPRDIMRGRRVFT